jgi:hypothetical protein
MATRKRTTKRATTTKRAPPDDAELATREAEGGNEASSQSDLADRVEEYRATAGERRCFQRDQEHTDRQCLLGSGHPAADDDGNPMGHVFEAGDGSFYELV